MLVRLNSVQVISHCGDFASGMKLIDYLTVTAILGCVFLAYAGYRFEAMLAVSVVIIVASWRFYDRSRNEGYWGGSDNLPDHSSSGAEGDHRGAGEGGSDSDL